MYILYFILEVSAVNLPLRNSRTIIAAILKRVEVLQLLLTSSIIEPPTGCINTSAKLRQYSPIWQHELFTAASSFSGSVCYELGRYGEAEHV